MGAIDTGHLIYLVVLGTAVVFWFVAANRRNLGKVLQQAVAWGLIFVGVIAAIGLWDDIRSTVRPTQTVFAENGRVELPRAPDGHYYLDALVNGAPVRFVVDTGASDIVLSRRDARTAGFDLDDLAFVGSANTANGVVRTAPVRLESFEIGTLRDSDLRAVVNEGDLHESLLGMSYLQRFGRVEIADGKLVLTR